MIELGEFLLRVFEGISSIRYLTSSAYRKRMHERWRKEKRIVFVADVIGGVIGLVLIIIIAWLAVHIAVGSWAAANYPPFPAPDSPP